MTHQDTNSVAVIVSSDKMQAHLVMREGVTESSMPSETVIAMAASQAIRQSDEFLAAVNKAIRGYAKHDFSKEETYRVLIAEGTPAVHGQNERFILDPSLVPDTPSEEDQEDSESQDYRERSAFLIVQKGQPLGILQAPTNGSDGVTITGEIVSAVPGMTIGFNYHDRSIERLENGTLVARIPGELILTPASAMISSELHIRDAVDFATGNIHFPGSVSVADGVRDGFEVSAGLGLSISGLVEAAYLEAGWTIHLQTGMAGRGKGTIVCGADLSARYLDGCEVRIGRDLVVENDINDCTIVVLGEVRSPKATFIGTELTCFSDCEMGAAGSPGGNRCVVSVGGTPECDRLMHEAAKILLELEAKANDCREKLDELHADPDQSASKSERLTHLQFELAGHQEKQKPLIEALDQTAAVATRASKLTIHEVLHQNTEIRMGGVSAVVSQDIEGPVEIKMNDQGEMICRDVSSNTSVLMASLASITPAEGAYRPQDLPQPIRPAA